jgi:hypothetical protein
MNHRWVGVTALTFVCSTTMASQSAVFRGLRESRPARARGLPLSDVSCGSIQPQSRRSAKTQTRVAPHRHRPALASPAQQLLRFGS